MKKTLLIAFVFALGYGYGRWYAKEPTPLSAATVPAQRKVLYYQDPMHPSYKSDKPGIAPDCNMALVPVYADTVEAPASKEPKTARQDAAIYISPEKQQLIGVQYGKAEYASAVQTIRAAAKVTLDETRVVRVSTKLDGWIDKVNVKIVGTHVKKNQELLIVYNPQSYKAQQEFIALAKAKMLGTPGLDEGKLVAAKMKLQLIGFADEDIDTIERARLALWRLPVYSPINGVVLEFNGIEKQKVTPDPLYTIADLSSVWVTADFLESDAPFVQVGQPATFTLASQPGRAFHGTVDSILPQIDPATRTLKVRVHFDNPDDALRPEMFGSLEIHAGSGKKLMVAQDAVMNSGLKQIVFVDRGDGYLEPRTVKTGRRYSGGIDSAATHSAATWIEIVSGLKAGERVVTSGNFLIDSEAQLRASSHHDR